MLCALIMAGGSGQRFWPLSTEETPKQLLKLFSNKTMILETVDRIQKLVPTERIYVATNIKQVEGIRKELPMIPEENIIIEPSFKDTGAAIGYSSLFINHRHPNTDLIVLASDHLIRNEVDFIEILKTAVKEAHENGTIVTLGIKPTRPETGYGYIETEIGCKVGNIYSVKRFWEKPNYERAEEYVASGHYLWNSGMFIFNIQTIFSEIERYMPRHHDIMKLLQLDVELGMWGEELAESVAIPFENFQKMSIDFGVMERSDRIRVIPTNFGWNDIGAFTALEEVFTPNENGTIVRNTDISEYNSKNNIVIGNGKHVAIVGAKDLVIVQTDDHLLICDKDHVQDIKRIVG